MGWYARCGCWGSGAKETAAQLASRGSETRTHTHAKGISRPI